MSNHLALQNSYGPEIVPSEALRSPPPESRYGQFDQAFESVHRNQGQPVATEKPKSRNTKVLGLSTWAFWAVAVITLLIILGIGIGVGVGIGLRHSNASAHASPGPSPTTQKSKTPLPLTSPSPSLSASKTSNETTKTASRTSSSIASSGTQGIASNSCNFTAVETYQASDGTLFTEYCFTDWPGGEPAAGGDGTVDDLFLTTVYTFTACIEACVSYNKNASQGNQRCGAITYNANLTSSVNEQGGNCFIKNMKGVDVQSSALVGSAAVAD